MSDARSVATDRRAARALGWLPACHPAEDVIGRHDVTPYAAKENLRRSGTARVKIGDCVRSQDDMETPVGGVDRRSQDTLVGGHAREHERLDTHV